MINRTVGLNDYSSMWYITEERELTVLAFLRSTASEPLALVHNYHCHAGVGVTFAPSAETKMS